jgi:hypothetical protein
LNASLDKPLLEPTLDPKVPCSTPPPLTEEPSTFEPAVLAMFPPPPSSDEGEKLTNENLLKSIGFLPGSNHSSFSPGVCEDKTPPLSSTSTDQLVGTFEMIENPSYTTSDVPRPPSGGGDEVDEDDFVVVVPDCFNLSKPLPDFSPDESFCNIDDAFVLDPNTTSCGSHVSVADPPQVDAGSIKSTTSQTSLERDGHVSTPMPDRTAPLTAKSTSDDDSEVCTGACSVTADGVDKPSEDNTSKAPVSKSVETTPTATPSSSPQTVHKNLGVSPRSRFSLRNLKKNPLSVASGIVDAVSGFVNEKVHFVPTTDEAATQNGRKPCIQFACGDHDDFSSDSSDDEEFQVRIMTVFCVFELQLVELFSML